MSEKLPYFPMYAAAFSTDALVIPMTYEAEGVYNALLRHQWINGRVPAELRQALPKTVSPEALAQVEPCFIADRSDPSFRFNPRLEEIRREVSSRHSSAVENGRKGGIVSGVTRRSRASTPPSKGGSSNPQARAYGSTSSKASVEAGTPREAEKKPSHQTWLTPFGEAWSAAYGGEPPYPKLARSLGKLLKTHTTDEVLGAWITYLGQTAADYASVARFAETYGRWNGTHVPPTQREKNERVLGEFYLEPEYPDGQ